MRRFIGLSTTKGAVRPSHRSPAMKVWVFQCPNGAFERSRWPFGHRPRRRVILVVVPVSSMNTRRWGSSRILGWRFAFHSWRAAATSGRSCSLASRVFFAAVAVADRSARDRGRADDGALPGQFGRQFRHGDVLLLGHPTYQEVPVRIEL